MFSLGRYRLVNKNGFVDANIANFNLAHEIISTGGIIIVKKVQGGNVMGVEYADGSKNDWACIWANESRFFEAIHTPTDEIRVLNPKPYNIDKIDPPCHKRPLKIERDFTGHPTQRFA